MGFSKIHEFGSSIGVVTGSCAMRSHDIKTCHNFFVKVKSCFAKQRPIKTFFVTVGGQ